MTNNNMSQKKAITTVPSTVTVVQGNKVRSKIQKTILPTVSQVLSNLGRAINSSIPKKRNLLIAWVDKWSDYIKIENANNSNFLRYKRGTIVHLDFGFNIGSELGGMHYAIVIEQNNPKLSPTVVVVPLGSAKAKKDKDGNEIKDENGDVVVELHDSEVFLGQVIPWKQTDTIAMPLCITQVSKLRIIQPIGNTAHTRIAEDILDLLDEKIKEYFLKKAT